jgi:aspartate/methionine/tyrosine aminotransferase
MAEHYGMTDIRRQMEELVLTYDETPGTRELRTSLARLYDVEADEILVTNGAIEANYLLFQTLVSPGDVVVVMFPAYQQLYEVAGALGAEVRRWELRFEEKFRPNLEALRDLIDERTQLIVINTPHNPTGAALTGEELRQILKWADEVGAYVLSDETYQGIQLYEGQTWAPPARTLSSLGISVGTLSKSLGLAGLRIGWIAATPELIEECWAYRDYSSISCSRLSDFLAVCALSLRSRLIERAVGIARHNLGVLRDFMADHTEHFDFVPPQAGLLTFPRLKQSSDSRQFCRELSTKKGVLLVPGWAFEVESFLRIGFGEDPELFQTGLQLLSEYVRAR